MSKKAEVVEEVKSNNVVKEEGREKEVIENLKVQLKNHLEQADYHKTMATKAQGALEVLVQLHPEEKQEN